MSVDEYVNTGRPEQLKEVSYGELLKLTSALGKPFDPATMVAAEGSSLDFYLKTDSEEANQDLVRAPKNKRMKP